MQQDIAANQKKKETLQSLCGMLFKKNYDLYLKHEIMLDDERSKRSTLAEEFQKRMSLVTDDLNT